MPRWERSGGGGLKGGKKGKPGTNARNERHLWGRGVLGRMVRRVWRRTGFVGQFGWNLRSRSREKERLADETPWLSCES